MTHDADLPIARIRELADDPRFLSAMRDFYDRLDERIAAHDPVCHRRGDCCRFDAFDHRLYVTPAELACFVGTVETEPAASDVAACPYQVGGLCRARHARPTGCRVFFCESAGAGWQESLTESALTELRRLHRRFDLPYAYVEWLCALRAGRRPSGSGRRGV